MPTSYTNNNGLAKPATGELNNTWGGTVNTSITDLIDEALDGVISVSLAGSSSSLPVTDGASSNGRNRIIVFTGSPGATHTVTLTPNDAEKWFLVKNSVSGGFGVVFAQGGGSGSTVTIANGAWNILYCDGTGTNANVVRIDDLQLSTVLLGDGTAGTPAVRFTSDTDTGLFRIGSNAIGVSAGGTQVAEVNSTYAVSGSLPLRSVVSGIDARLSPGTGSNAAVGTFSNHALLFYTNSSEKARLTAGGYFGLGTSTVSFGGMDVVASNGFANSGANVAWCASFASAGNNNAIRLATGTSANPSGWTRAINWGSQAYDFSITAFKDDGTDVDTHLHITENGRVVVGPNVNTATIPASAALYVESSTGAFIPPRLTTAQRNLLTPFSGMIIFNADFGKIECYDGTSWRFIAFE